ncbi:MAG: methyl-accepting chemotaxis protein [Treponema sp.]|jgi:methyl-accepting chemotaxis protein|nr:methyl-accepting chemotaxis protein [Treponema sp.]
MNTAPATSQQKPASKRDLFSHKMKRLVHYINSKFKIMVFEIISRSHMLNATIIYLHDTFIRVSDVMRNANDSFQKNSEVLTSVAKDNQRYIENVDHNFAIIDKTFDDSFQLADALNGIAKVTGDNLSAIHNIAELTNILALNASIEAARAGAAGKGFAVVAQEIRKHAATTKDAIGTISENIKRLIVHIDSLSGKMDAMKDEVKEGKALVQKIVALSERENTALSAVNADIASIDATFQEYGRIAETLNKTIEQSNISKTDIEQMLVLFQDSMESIEKVEDSY